MPKTTMLFIGTFFWVSYFATMIVRRNPVSWLFFKARDGIIIPPITLQGLTDDEEYL